MDAQKRKQRNLWMFPLGTVGRDMIYSLFINFILTYILFTRQLTAAQLSAVTVVMVVARVFDAINDPLMGNIIERTRSRFGKFKPWLCIGIVLTSIVVYLAFNTNLQGWSFVWFFGIIYLLYSITYTMHDIAYWGMVAALSSDADERNRFTSRATLFAGIGGTLASVLIPMFTTGSMTIGGSANIAFGRIALVVCILSPLFLCFTIFGAEERRDKTAKAAPPVSVRKILSTITGNDQLLWISLIFLIQQVGNGIVVGGLGSTYIYFDFGYNGGLYSLFTIVGMSATAVLMVGYPAISRRIHRKKLMGVMAVISTAGYLTMLLAGMSMPGGNMVKYWLIVIGYMLSNFGQYCFYLIMMISIINTVEYNEYLHGFRDEAIITSLRPFLTKMASALIVLITSGSYLLFGVTSFTNQISDMESMAASGAMTEAAKLEAINDVISGVGRNQATGLLLCMTLIPWVLMLVSYVLYRKHYRLDEAEYEHICNQLAAREAQQETEENTHD